MPTSACPSHAELPNHQNTGASACTPSSAYIVRMLFALHTQGNRILKSEVAVEPLALGNRHYPPLDLVQIALAEADSRKVFLPVPDFKLECVCPGSTPPRVDSSPLVGLGFGEYGCTLYHSEWCDAVTYWDLNEYLASRSASTWGAMVKCS